MAIPALGEASSVNDDERERRDALVGLAQRSLRKAHAIARDLLGDAAEAEDAVQESLARACTGFADLRDPGALEGWFFRVLTHHCLRTLRRRRFTSVLRRLWAGAAVVDDDLVDESPRADDELGRRREVAVMLRGLAGLPDQQRTCLVLRYGHDLGVGQIAAMLGVGEGTVKTHLVRGLSRLREGAWR
jgi:RNA polymerase sigma-70 factor (ECF subfamily)